MLNLYEKIKAVEQDDEKWMNVLEEANDDEFVQNNVEYRLGKDFGNRKLWELYIQFWKSRNTKVSQEDPNDLYENR